ncbi:helix-turn-helix domain-containing protein [Roseimaritima sediminicola]|uniref:helix-turn-helix domain-containing protein n=1 Tax=Roseimaritima sediminicola TaxID=2662066 RepID=UPI0013873411|nr:helix-turn-helix domain-containing protein [Roseimaritima sediminicola]
MTNPDLLRGQQLFALRKLVLDAFTEPSGSKVSGAAMKAVLRAIDDHGAKCWASITTIATETCQGEKTVRRAVKALESMGLVTVTPNAGQTSILEINWKAIPTPVTTTEVTPETTPVMQSTTPVTMTGGAGHAAHNPGHDDRQSDKKRKVTEKKRKSLVADRDEECYRVASWMFGLILQVAPKEQQPNLNQWANTIRLMRDRDRHTIAEIKQVFQWANADDFWRVNIRSPDKLRKQFANLHARMTNPSNGKPRTANVGAGVNYDPQKELSWR